MDDAIKVALSSMVSTARANLSVGPPYDLGVYSNGSLTLNEHRIESDSPYLQALQDAWVSTLIDAVATLPALPSDLID
jgi:putative proteasome-type protease